MTKTYTHALDFASAGKAKRQHSKKSNCPWVRGLELREGINLRSRRSA